MSLFNRPSKQPPESKDEAILIAGVRVVLTQNTSGADTTLTIESNAKRTVDAIMEKIREEIKGQRVLFESRRGTDESSNQLTIGTNVAVEVDMDLHGEQPPPKYADYDRVRNICRMLAERYPTPESLQAGRGK